MPGNCKPHINHIHVFYKCDYAISVWANLTQKITNLLDRKAKYDWNEQQHVLLCIFAKMPDQSDAPTWWILLQRITIRHIWLTYSSMTYGKGPTPGEPQSQAQAIINTFYNRVKNEFRTMQSRGKMPGHKKQHTASLAAFKRKYYPVIHVVKKQCPKNKDGIEIRMDPCLVV